MKSLALTLLIAVSPAWAGSPPASEAVPPPEFHSAFADYKPMQDSAISDWRQANSEVGRLQGHMGHLDPRESQSAPTTARAQPAGKPSSDERR